ncbi:MAG: KpsF/GutQ family sugar-phosphate isomerase [Ignavibacteriaceae bacterium]|nr:MAG: KpsF/GutQ family sugar-phosphate isomerase [Chlorobiota bacterium]KXK06406.1 MAG: KpsF/GutQ [Chlorobi bacterium OLB4]MBV6399082.1 Arabinose 5-phosphate isomerase KdsD [Ignavibacteria bacterium]MCC6885300.1 KpsF/GutQ family sugar-phosphate isomerase [Ignavibacteriales bacterium]MCE7953297.1 KpsF/GutQ family sugar-phosphate isomerase [Chlorobi bacterium CHB7]MDL1887285.1 KpsF/GutQ family sugar-phosphate isomerase [Ignavibacteria bacterium CHB1]MEB2330160.1 KpsF/GutQ family sugar-phospha
MKNKIISNAKKVVSLEKSAIQSLEQRFADKKFSAAFTEAVELIYKCKGKVVVSGMGKSGIIAQKIVATFNSTGTYSIFMHAADSVHGDLGVLRENDVVILISKSGDTGQIKNLIPVIKSLKLKIIGIVGDVDSELARQSDIVLDVSVKQEACPHNLAPTSSTTTTLVIGDAIAVSLLQLNGFTKENFASFHPGGNLGKKLLLKVQDLMFKNSDIPVVKESAGIKDVIYEISSKRLGCTIVARNKTVRGIITDGDIRRLLEKSLEIKNVKANEIMSKNPKLIPQTLLASNALEIMETNKITSLIVVNPKGKITGLLHIHTLIEHGL